MTPANESFAAYRKYLLQFCEETTKDIDDMNDDIAILRSDLEDVRKEIKALQIEHSAQGARWGIIVGVIAFISSIIPILLHWFLIK